MTKEKETQFWSVTVSRNGEDIVTIASNFLSGRDISDEDARVIRMAAEHLRSFVGEENSLFIPTDETRTPEASRRPDREADK